MATRDIAIQLGKAGVRLAFVLNKTSDTSAWLTLCREVEAMAIVALTAAGAPF
jgi:hypothetical protein